MEIDYKNYTVITKFKFINYRGLRDIKLILQI